MVYLVNVLAVIIAAAALNYAIFKRSLMATVVEAVLKLTPFKRRYSLKRLEKLKRKGRREKIPKYCQKTAFGSMKVLIFGGKRTRHDRLVIYLHGGAYMNRPLAFHWKFFRKLARKCSVPVVVPLYPIAPEGCLADAHRLVGKLYIAIKKRFSGKIVLMGDSAGGGLAAAVCMRLKKFRITLPDKLILLSPWLKVEKFGPELKKRARIDPVLDPKQLYGIAVCWARGIDTDSPWISPVNGDPSAMDGCLIFVGTREIFFAGVVEFYRKIRMCGYTATLHVGKGLNHVYPLYPVPEARKAFAIIKKAVLTC